MSGGGSKPGQRRGGRKPGTPNKLPKGERALVKLNKAERELRVLAAAGKDITTLGKDRLAQLDAWAYEMAQGFAPHKVGDRLHWDNDGDELRFMRFMSFCGKCAAARAQFESPRYAAIALANQGEKIREIFRRNPHQVFPSIAGN